MPRFTPAIMCTAVEPWDERYELAEDLFRHQIREMVTHGTKNVYIFGTAGEGFAVTEKQFDHVVRVFSETMRSVNAEPMVGVINLSLSVIIERIARSREMGVKQFQISLPSWGVLADAELFTFFREVCGRFPDCRFLHYNLMRTKRLVTGAEYARLAAEHQNLVATKNSTDSMGRVHELITLAPELTHFLSEDGYTYGSMIGTCGLLASLPPICWPKCHAFFEAGQKRDFHKLLSMQHEITQITHGLMESMGHAPHIDGAYDKMLWKLTDRRFPLRLLPPYQGATDAEFNKFATFMKDKFPEWTNNK